VIDATIAASSKTRRQSACADIGVARVATGAGRHLDGRLAPVRDNPRPVRDAAELQQVLDNAR
jgi:hypothetical protein